MATHFDLLSIAGSVGKPIISRIKCCIHDGFVSLGDPQINAEYIYYILTLDDPYVGLGKHGTQLNLNTQYIGSISIPIPSAKEIEQILDRVMEIEQEFTKPLEIQKTQIDLLNQLRSVLIAEAVTGKIKV